MYMSECILYNYTCVSECVCVCVCVVYVCVYVCVCVYIIINKTACDRDVCRHEYVLIHNLIE